MALTRPDRVSLQRARAREVDLLVLEIARKMASGQWVAGPSHAELAQREGVDPITVRQWAAEAGRFLRLSREEDRDAIIARDAATLETVVQMAMDAGQPDLKAAIAGLAQKHKLLGLNAPEKHQHAHVVATYDQLPVGDRLAQVREAIAALQAEEAALLLEVGPDKICQPVVEEPGRDDG